jgi:hypothetical protein
VETGRGRLNRFRRRRRRRRGWRSRSGSGSGGACGESDSSSGPFLGTRVSLVIGGREGDRVATILKELAVGKSMIRDTTVTTERTLEASEQGMFLIVGETPVAHPIAEAWMLVRGGDFVGGGTGNPVRGTGIRIPILSLTTRSRRFGIFSG